MSHKRTESLLAYDFYSGDRVFTLSGAVEVVKCGNSHARRLIDG